MYRQASNASARWAQATPSQIAVAGELREAARVAIDALPDDYREVIVLSRVVGLDRAEVAAQMERTEGLGTLDPRTRDSLFAARVVGVKSGIPEEAGALHVVRACASGLQAILSAQHGEVLRQRVGLVPLPRAKRASEFAKSGISLPSGSVPSSWP